jgi:pimeloyl-ACP methyl ester carboxylesterase
LLLGPVEQTEALAARFRVIVPELPDPGSDIAPWLAAFLEGLGTQDVVVVAADQYRAAALELARTDPDRVERVVLASDLTRFLGGG